MPYSTDELDNLPFYQSLIRQDEAKYLELIDKRTDSGVVRKGVLRDPNSRNIILFEKINIRKGIGIALGLVGASTLILDGGNVSRNTDYMLGNMFVFINATSYGLYLVLAKPLMQKYHPFTVMFYVFAFGLLYVLPFGYTELLEVEWTSFPSIIIWEVIFVVVCTTFIAYLLNTSALRILNPSTVSIYIYLQPVLATIFAVWVGSDTISQNKIISAIIIFIGVYLVSVRSLKERKQKLS